MTGTLATVTGEPRPWRCPVCEGRGHVTAGFYTYGLSASTAAETCRSCRGAGIVWWTAAAGYTVLTAEQAETV
jgi:DnaJ-class molecular chaperone